MRYPGQEYSLTVQVALEGDRIVESADELARRFAVAYKRNYGHSFDGPVEVESVRAIERTSLPRPATSATTAAAKAATAAGGYEIARAYSFARGEWCDFRIIERDTLRPGDEFDGPAIVVETTTTSYFDDGFFGVVHDTGALVVTDMHAGDRPPRSHGRGRGRYSLTRMQRDDTFPPVKVVRLRLPAVDRHDGAVNELRVVGQQEGDKRRRLLRARRNGASGSGRQTRRRSSRR